MFVFVFGWVGGELVVVVGAVAGVVRGGVSRDLKKGVRQRGQEGC